MVLADSAEPAREYADHFVRVGVDSLTGRIESLAGLPSAVPQVSSPEAGRLITFCQSGLRNSMAASALRRDTRQRAPHPRLSGDRVNALSPAPSVTLRPLAPRGAERRWRPSPTRSCAATGRAARRPLCVG